MYFVDQKTIEEKLNYLEHILNFFAEKNEWSGLGNKFALERVTHIVIESVIDIGNNIIDGFIMRDPGSYEDIIDILLDENVIGTSDAKVLKQMISLRSSVVRDYTNIDQDVLFKSLNEHLTILHQFPLKVRAYLKNELGQVTTFIPKER